MTVHLQPPLHLRIAAHTELIVMPANVFTIHLKPISSLMGPTHGCAYLFVVIATWRSRRYPAAAKVLALVPGAGGLLAAHAVSHRRWRSAAAGGRAPAPPSRTPPAGVRTAVTAGKDPEGRGPDPDGTGSARHRSNSPTTPTGPWCPRPPRTDPPVTPAVTLSPDCLLTCANAHRGQGERHGVTEDRDLFQMNEDFLRRPHDGDLGHQENAATDNHGTFYDMQLAALAYATGDEDLARRTVRQAATTRIIAQIAAADGSRPQELARTRSWHYSAFTLVAHTRPAAIGRHVGVDLWSYEGPDGQSPFQAVDHLLPAATEAAAWPHPELELHRYAATDVVHAAADAGDSRARKAPASSEAPPGGDLRLLRPRRSSRP